MSKPSPWKQNDRSNDNTKKNHYHSIGNCFTFSFFLSFFFSFLLYLFLIQKKIKIKNEVLHVVSDTTINLVLLSLDLCLLIIIETGDISHKLAFLVQFLYTTPFSLHFYLYPLSSFFVLYYGRGNQSLHHLPFSVRDPVRWLISAAGQSTTHRGVPTTINQNTTPFESFD